MHRVGKQVAVGAAWMIGLRLIERGIGFVSTLILARLLLPADFGLVAMAMAVFAFIEIGGQFGFDLALIRDREASRAHYDSAWTLQVGYGAFTAVALAALAVPSGHYFNEPRLAAILYALALIALVQGFENIGTVDFRKEFRFGKDFQLMFVKKVASFVVTVGLALAFRSHWALIGGMAASRFSGVALSFMLHPYRPRLDLSETRGLLTFSRWIVLRGVLGYFIERGPDFIIGRFLEATSLGFYRVAREIATLPTTELIFPIMRAVFPGYADVAHDRTQLARSFLTVQGMIVMLTLPAGVGIVMLAEPIVALLLGPHWVDAVPLIRILGLYGALTVFQATNISIFNVLGVPQWGAALKGAEVAILLPAMFGVLALDHGLVDAAWVVFGAETLVTPVGIFLIERLMGIGFKDRLAVAWRPVLGTLAMAAALQQLGSVLGPVDGAGSAAWHLIVTIPVGALVFLVTVFVLWRLAGRPSGAESRAHQLWRQRFGAEDRSEPAEYGRAP